MTVIIVWWWENDPLLTIIDMTFGAPGTVGTNNDIV